MFDYTNFFEETENDRTVLSFSDIVALGTVDIPVMTLYFVLSDRDETRNYKWFSFFGNCVLHSRMYDDKLDHRKVIEKMIELRFTKKMIDMMMSAFVSSLVFDLENDDTLVVLFHVAQCKTIDDLKQYLLEEKGNRK